MHSDPHVRGFHLMKMMIINPLMKSIDLLYSPYIVASRTRQHAISDLRSKEIYFSIRT